MNDDSSAPNFNPLSDPAVRRVNGRIAALQAQVDQVTEGLRLSRLPVDFLHRHGIVELRRVVGEESANGLARMLAAWAFASLELADMRASVEEMELLGDELRRKEGDSDQG